MTGENERASLSPSFHSLVVWRLKKSFKIHYLPDYIHVLLTYNSCLTAHFLIFKLILILMSFFNPRKTLVESITRLVDSHCDQRQMLKGIVESFVIHDRSWWAVR